ncbi:MAG: sugar kinase [Geobacteraceae bacterium GWC2_58_44]|nr:MAG: sugar kinase [Geobacteraceae bacterium GWC2_58_44]HBG07192.1 ROK family protein [Geobacter sp.]
MDSVCIGVDVGGTNLRCALVTPGGVLLRRESQATAISSGSASFLARLLLVLNRLKGEAEASGMRVVAAGLGVPGLISNQGVLHSSVNLLPLQGLNLARAVSTGTGLPVVALNDANASAIGEQRFGAGKPYRSSLMLTIGTGVGAGLILDGRLWTGVDGVAGEFGHITVEPNGRPCGCGNRGCLEQYVSATAISACAAGDPRDGRSPEAAAVAARALQGNPESAGIFEQAGSYLGIAAAGVVNLLNLEAIILGGGVARSFELLAAPMRREISARAFAIPGARVRILRGELGDDAGVLGAAATAFDTASFEKAGS